MEHGTHAMHMAQANQLANPDDATHVAIRSGDWSDPSTWEGGRVPGAEAQVYIPAGTQVIYDVDSEVPLATVRVDGHLKFSTSQDTNMLVETIVTGHGSKFEVGSAADPMPVSIDATVTFRDTPINRGQDPDQLSHGLMAFGEVEVQGASKESHLKLDGQVNRGDRTIEVDGNTANWEVGDTIVIIGTGNGSRDEERVITAINGDQITFNQALSYDHNPPQGMDFDTYVGNLSRNVTFRSEDADGVRGHVMLHNGMGGSDGISNSVQFAAFEDMGRTDASIGTSANNPAGRYPLHLHEIGTEPDSALNILNGNAINGAPGWGITHHSSHAAVNNNFVYDTVGSGIISEMGDETGEWLGNLVSSVDGDGVANPSSQSNGFLVGSEGAAYENQSRVIIQQDNVAANSHIGWNWSGRESFEFPSINDGVHRKMFEREQVPFDPSPFDVALDHEEPPIIDFNDNTVIGADTALRVFHRQYSDDTDTMSVFKNFNVWGGGDAVHLDNYASNYQFMDSVWQGSGVGFRIERKTSSVVFNDVEFHDFGTGYRSFGVNHEVVLIDTTFEGVSNRFDLADLMRNISDGGKRAELIAYYRDNHGIDYTNPMPKIVNSNSLNEVSAITFTADAGSDMTIGPSDRTLEFTGTIRDSVGVRNFNEYAIAKSPSGNGSSKDFEGIDLYLGATQSGRQVQFQPEELIALHGTYQKADGTWVTPVVNWITDRLTGDHHPVVIEIKLDGFDTATLNRHRLDAYPDPGLNNPKWYVDNSGARPGPQDDHDHGGGHDMGHMMPPPATPDDGHDIGHDMPAPAAPVHDHDMGDDVMPGHQPDAPDDSGSNPAFGPAEGDGAMHHHAKPNHMHGDDDDNVLEGGHGRDLMFGGDGDDVLEGGDGRDHLFGGDGADRFVADEDSRDEIHDFSVADGDLLDLSDVAGRFGLSSAQMEAALNLKQLGRGTRVDLELEDATHSLVVIRGVQADVLRKTAPWILDGSGEAVADEADAPVVAAPVAEELSGLVGDHRHNVLTDGAEDTLIKGLGGRDVIEAGAGNDVIDGGAGRDDLTGGEGADVFVFGADGLDGYRDDIRDFSAAEGDKIDLSGIGEAYGLSADEVSATLDLSKIQPGLRIQLDLDGTSHKVALLHGLDEADIADVQDALLF